MSYQKKSILEMSHEEARNFLLKSENYFTLNLPSYFNIDSILNQAIDKMEDKILSNKNNSDTEINIVKSQVKYSDYPNINFCMQLNKTSNSYRPITLIHPYLYVDLVNAITKSDSWTNLVTRFNELRSKVKNQIECFSIPFEVEGQLATDYKKELALHFWKKIEQESIRLSIEYSYMLKLNISNFYGSIYTHSLHWAIIGEENAKEDHNSFGSGIDKRFQWMNYRETVGIPQGNVVSDFFAELLLAYIDVKLVDELEISKISGYHILRYRDDYRIFTNSIDELHKIKKILSVILQRYKLSLGDSKTKLSDNVVKDSIKEDKLYWLKHNPVVKLSGDKFYKKPEKFFSNFLSYVGFSKKKSLSKRRFKNYFDNRIYSATVQKHLFIIKDFADRYPNSGQLVKALNELKNRIDSFEEEDFIHNGTDIDTLISILVDIILKNPKMTSIGIQLLSILLLKFNIQDSTNIYKKFETIKKIRKKLENFGENEYLDIWLNRLIVQIIYKSKDNNLFEDYLSSNHNKLVSIANDIVTAKEISEGIFEEEWLIGDFKIDFEYFIDINEIVNLPDKISDDEITLIEYSEM